jgi:uncharacterized protein (DUF427 family)
MGPRIERVQPGPGQESVWDYPRPPALVPSAEHVRVVLGGVVIADTRAALRVLETSHPPTYYLPVADFRHGALRAAPGGSLCEWKGEASYLDLPGRRQGGLVLPHADRGLRRVGRPPGGVPRSGRRVHGRR